MNIPLHLRPQAAQLREDSAVSRFQRRQLARSSPTPSTLGLVCPSGTTADDSNPSAPPTLLRPQTHQEAGKRALLPALRGSSSHNRAGKRNLPPRSMATSAHGAASPSVTSSSAKEALSREAVGRFNTIGGPSCVAMLQGVEATEDAKRLIKHHHESIYETSRCKVIEERKKSAAVELNEVLNKVFKYYDAPNLMDPALVEQQGDSVWEDDDPTTDSTAFLQMWNEMRSRSPGHPISPEDVVRALRAQHTQHVKRKDLLERSKGAHGKSTSTATNSDADSTVARNIIQRQRQVHSAFSHPSETPALEKLQKKAIGALPTVMSPSIDELLILLGKERVGVLTNQQRLRQQQKATRAAQGGGAGSKADQENAEEDEDDELAFQKSMALQLRWMVGELGSAKEEVSVTHECYHKLIRDFAVVEDERVRLKASNEDLDEQLRATTATLSKDRLMHKKLIGNMESQISEIRSQLAASKKETEDWKKRETEGGKRLKELMGKQRALQEKMKEWMATEHRRGMLTNPAGGSVPPQAPSDFDFSEFNDDFAMETTTGFSASRNNLGKKRGSSIRTSSIVSSVHGGVGGTQQQPDNNEDSVSSSVASNLRWTASLSSQGGGGGGGPLSPTTSPTLGMDGGADDGIKPGTTPQKIRPTFVTSSDERLIAGENHKETDRHNIQVLPLPDPTPQHTTHNPSATTNNGEANNLSRRQSLAGLLVERASSLQGSARESETILAQEAEQLGNTPASKNQQPPRNAVNMKERSSSRKTASSVAVDSTAVIDNDSEYEEEEDVEDIPLLESNGQDDEESVSSSGKMSHSSTNQQHAATGGDVPTPTALQASNRRVKTGGSGGKSDAATPKRIKPKSGKNASETTEQQTLLAPVVVDQTSSPPRTAPTSTKPSQLSTSSGSPSSTDKRTNITSTDTIPDSKLSELKKENDQLQTRLAHVLAAKERDLLEAKRNFESEAGATQTTLLLLQGELREYKDVAAAASEAADNEINCVRSALYEGLAAKDEEITKLQKALENSLEDSKTYQKLSDHYKSRAVDTARKMSAMHNIMISAPTLQALLLDSSSCVDTETAAEAIRNVAEFSRRIKQIVANEFADSVLQSSSRPASAASSSSAAELGSAGGSMNLERLFTEGPEKLELQQQYLMGGGDAKRPGSPFNPLKKVRQVSAGSIRKIGAPSSSVLDGIPPRGGHTGGSRPMSSGGRSESNNNSTSCRSAPLPPPSPSSGTFSPSPQLSVLPSIPVGPGGGSAPQTPSLASLVLTPHRQPTYPTSPIDRKDMGTSTTPYVVSPQTATIEPPSAPHEAIKPDTATIATQTTAELHSSVGAPPLANNSGTIETTTKTVAVPAKITAPDAPPLANKPASKKPPTAPGKKSIPSGKSSSKRSASASADKPSKAAGVPATGASTANTTNSLPSPTLSATTIQPSPDMSGSPTQLSQNNSGYFARPRNDPLKDDYAQLEQMREKLQMAVTAKEEAEKAASRTSKQLLEDRRQLAIMAAKTKSDKDEIIRLQGENVSLGIATERNGNAHKEDKLKTRKQIEEFKRIVNELQSKLAVVEQTASKGWILDKSKMFLESSERSIRHMEGALSATICSYCLDPVHLAVVCFPCGHISCESCFLIAQVDKGVVMPPSIKEAALNAKEFRRQAEAAFVYGESGPVLSSDMGVKVAGVTMNTVTGLPTRSFLPHRGGPQAATESALLTNNEQNMYFCSECNKMSGSHFLRCARFDEVGDKVRSIKRSIEEIQEASKKVFAMEQMAIYLEQQETKGNTSAKRQLNNSNGGNSPSSPNSEDLLPSPHRHINNNGSRNNSGGGVDPRHKELLDQLISKPLPPIGDRSGEGRVVFNAVDLSDDGNDYS